MIRPGVNVVIKEQPPARSSPTDTGVFFACGTSDSGPTYPVLIQSIADFVAVYGARQSYSLLYDAMDSYFREGGRLAYISRVVGPSPVVATRNLLDAGSGISLVVSAIGPGSYGNSLKVGVVSGVAGGTFQIQVSDASNNVLEQSGDLPDQASAVAWGLNSLYVRIALGATALIPAVAALAALASGTDDRSNITDTQWASALALFSPDLGPGQVAYPGRTTDTAHTQLLAHATGNNRIALLDMPDTATVATLTTAAINARTNGRWGGSFAPWYVVPGVTPYTTRTVPPSAIIAGIIARNDVTLNANVAAAGLKNGQSAYAQSLSQAAWSDANRQTLNGQGVNVAVVKNGAIVNYGFRSLTNPTTDPAWVDLGNSRLTMAIAAQGQDILDNHVFDDIDGQGHLFGLVTGELMAMLNAFYKDGALFGETSGDAFVVVCDSSNNTPTTIANRELHATVAYRASQFAEMVELDLVKVPVNQTIA